MRPLRIFLPLALAWAFGPGAVLGQTVFGRVVEAGTGRPVRGAFVSLLDAGNVRRAGALADETGAFGLAAPAPGRYRLRAERVGHGSATSQRFELGAGDTVRHRLEMPVEAVALAGIVAQPAQVCRLGPAQGRQTQRVWEEARKALEVAAWTQQEEIFRYDVLRYARDLDPENLRVVHEQVSEAVVRASRPFTSVPPERLAGGGFVQSTTDGRLYFAPDAGALLSDAFLRTHCFHVTTDPQAPELLGLAFEPAPGRSLPEIRGALWLDRRSGRLRHVDYRYVNLDLDVPTAQLGGRVEFEALPNGAWIPRRWYIRMPAIGVRRMDWRGRQRQREELRALREEGGEVLRIFDSAGELVGIPTARPALAQGFHGKLTDAVTGAPLEDATVVLVSEAGRDMLRVGSDSAGEFRLPAPKPGRYSLRVERIGYADFRSDLIELGPREQIEVRVLMTVDAVDIAPLEVVARSQLRPTTAFERRLDWGRKTGTGVFFTREELEQAANQRLGTLLQRVPRLPLEYNEFGGVHLGKPGRAGAFTQGNCRSYLYFNGVPIDLADSTLSLDDLITPGELDGIEVYRSKNEVPAEFARSDACAVVVLWTREGEPASGEWSLVRSLVGLGALGLLLGLFFLR